MIRLSKTKKRNPNLEKIADEILQIPFEYLSMGGDAETYVFEIKKPDIIDNVLLPKGKYVLKIYFPNERKIDPSTIKYFKSLSSKKLIPKIYVITKNYIIMEYIEGNTMLKLLENNKNFDDKTYTTPGQWYKIFRMIEREVNNWHTKNCAHGDLNPGNIIIQKDKVVLIDPSFVPFKYQHDEDTLIRLQELVF